MIRIAPNWQETERRPNKPRRKFTGNYCGKVRRDSVKPEEVCKLMRQWKRP